MSDYRSLRSEAQARGVTRVKGDPGEGPKEWYDYSPPAWQAGRRGKRWGVSLQAARRHGAVIVAEETGETVISDRSDTRRPWVGLDSGQRFTSRECIPTW